MALRNLAGYDPALVEMYNNGEITLSELNAMSPAPAPVSMMTASPAAQQQFSSISPAPSMMAPATSVLNAALAPAQGLMSQVSSVQPAQAPVNPFTLDYQQFLKAVSPYMNATSLESGYTPGGWATRETSGASIPYYQKQVGLGNSWASPEGQNGSIALTLANGQTWTPSGANSGITFVPKGTLLNPLKAQDPNSDQNDPFAAMSWKPEYSTEDTWKISGDMSALLGLTDTNAHKTIEYKLQGSQLVPAKVEDWQYTNNGLGGFINDVITNPALGVFLAATGGAALSGMGGTSAAASNAGMLSGVGSSAAPMAFGGAELTAGQLAAVASGTEALTAAEIAAITGGVGSASGMGAVASVAAEQAAAQVAQQAAAQQAVEQAAAQQAAAQQAAQEAFRASELAAQQAAEAANMAAMQEAAAAQQAAQQAAAQAAAEQAAAQQAVEQAAAQQAAAQAAAEQAATQQAAFRASEIAAQNAAAQQAAVSTATGFGGVGTDLAVTGAASGSLAPAEIAAITAPAAVAPEAAAGSGMLTGGVSTAPAGFGGAAVTDAQLAAAVGSGAGELTAAQIAAITGGVGSASGAGASGGLLSGIGSAIGNGVSTVSDAVTPIANALGTTPGGLLGTGANLLGGYLNTEAAQAAAQTQADAQIRAAQIAADAAKFRPVGVSTRFGTSQFGFDPTTGYLNSAGYTLSPEMKAQQDALMSTSNGMLTQFQGSQAATAPMADAAARMMSLGNQYLATDPQAQAQKYMADQQALLAAGRNTDMAKLQAQMQAQGRGGFSIGGGDGMYASNPQMQALLNAQRQQDLGLAAQATQGGQQYATFGSGLVGAGGSMLSSMYGTQKDAFAPYQTALGGAQTIEGLGQNALDMGINLGKTSTTANANAGQLLGQGYSNAAGTIGAQAGQAGSTWGNLLQGLGQGTQQYRFDPFTGKAL